MKKKLEYTEIINPWLGLEEVFKINKKDHERSLEEPECLREEIALVKQMFPGSKVVGRRKDAQAR